jgi:hypothetical protein
MGFMNVPLSSNSSRRAEASGMMVAVIVLMLVGWRFRP